MTLPETDREGRYSRVCDPTWADCADTSFARRAGGRWNPAGEFGALYLNASVVVAAANARRVHAGRAIGLFDLRPEALPMLALFDVPKIRVADAVTDAALQQLGLPPTFRAGDDWTPCQAIARTAYSRGLAGVASRSAADAQPGSTLGEELAVFDRLELTPIGSLPFDEWYPHPAPP